MSLGRRGCESRWLGAALGLLLLGACGAPESRPATPAEVARDAVAGEVAVALSVPHAALASRESAWVTVTLTNVSGSPVRVLKRHTVAGGLREDLLSVTVDGVSVPYQGRRYHWAPPRETDFLRLEPGEQVSHVVDIGAVYDLSRTGHYRLRYQAPAVERANVAALRSDDLEVDIAGRPFVAPWREAPGTVSAQALTTSHCVEPTHPAATLNAAFSAARAMAADGLQYFNLFIPPSRYTNWFGTTTSARVATVKRHFQSISGAFETQSVVIDCSCTDADSYSYVYPSDPFRIFVCGLFWAAPTYGTDSKGGLLVHEMSHFTAVAGTDEWATGQTACRALATSNPTKAIDNADSHEYFAEDLSQ
ncbi:peptidase M35 [Corallococcus sp. M34]|uniref:M35 family metallo-endopeptidase n=1 Tax=Citreicoccus inhibens TaxID=2849499 RepID=UPI001C23148C|nr:M35 family metallo-endopeptidase [Citreicoccus inhibens]MBU8894010.1 peptidase M35 [Citreicoccus inhibens]